MAAEIFFLYLREFLISKYIYLRHLENSIMIILSSDEKQKMKPSGFFAAGVAALAAASAAADARQIAVTHGRMSPTSTIPMAPATSLCGSSYQCGRHSMLRMPILTTFFSTQALSSPDSRLSFICS